MMNMQNTENVYNILKQSCSQTPEELHNATNALKSLETSSNFCEDLCRIWSNKQVEDQVRLMAIIYMKNLIDKYWRPNIQNSLSMDSKTTIKSIILQFDEEIPSIAKQQSNVIGKIARYDVLNWPELFPSIILNLQTNEQSIFQRRSIEILLNVMKCLASKRLSADRKIFCNISQQLFPIVSDLWYSKPIYQNSANLLKIIRQIIIFGFSPHIEEKMHSVLQHILERMENDICNFRSINGDNEQYIILSKICIYYCKIIRDTVDEHPMIIGKFVSGILNLIAKLAFGNSVKNPDDLKICIILLNSFNSIMCIPEYKVIPSKDVKYTVDVNTNEGMVQKTAFFTYETLVQLGRHLILDMLVISENKLLLWQESPEEYANEDYSGEAYKYVYEACVERLFVCALKEYSQQFSPLIIEILKEPNLTVFKREALYRAIGLASFQLYDELDFNDLFKNRLIHDLNSTELVLKRRVIWLIGKWINVKFSLKVEVFDIINVLLDNNDLVIRFETADTLRQALDDFDLDIKRLLPNLEQIFFKLHKLLLCVSEVESKIRVLNIISFTIERCGRSMAPFTSNLIDYLPNLWMATEKEYLLQSSVLVASRLLVENVQGCSIHLINFLLPVINFSIDLETENHVYLLEDGLDLWLTFIQSLETLPSDDRCLELLTKLQPIMECSTENLRVCLKIIESFMLLCPNSTLNIFKDFDICLSSLMGDLKNEGIALILKTVDVALQLFSPEIFRKCLDKVFLNLIKPEESLEENPIITSYQLTILARLILNDVSKYSNLTGNFNFKIIDLFFQQNDCHTITERKKVSTLAIIRLFELPTYRETIVSKNFNSFISFLVENCYSIFETTENTDMFSDSLFIVKGEKQSNDSQALEELSCHEKRKLALNESDIIYSVDLVDIVQQFMSSLNKQYCDLWNNIDQDVVIQLRHLIKM